MKIQIKSQSHDQKHGSLSLEINFPRMTPIDKFDYEKVKRAILHIEEVFYRYQEKDKS